MRTHIEIGAQVVTLALVGCLTGCSSGRDDGPGSEQPGQDDSAQDDGEVGEQADADSSEGGGGEPDNGEMETSGGTGTMSCGDVWEPNPSAEQPSMVIWEAADEWTAYREIDDADLCAGEDDWYSFDVESLGYAQHYLYVRALIKDAGLCGAGCGQPVIPAGPQHAMTVEVYRAQTLQLLETQTDDDGVIVINGPGGDAYAHDLLIHVFSPTPSAEYPYRLSVSIRNYDGEDECEC